MKGEGAWICQMETISYGGKMHSPFLRLSVYRKFNDWFAVLRGKIKQNFNASKKFF